MKHFDSVYIEITNTCNLSCSFCPGTKRKKEFMDVHLFKHILNDFKDRCSFIFLHVMGEPLRHPQLEKILRLASQSGHRVNLTTNGILLRKHLDVLKNSPALRQVNVSLHWLSEVEDENYINTYMKDLIYFINATRHRDAYYIALRLWNMDETGFNKSNEIVARAIDDEFNLKTSVLDTKATYRGILLDSNIFLNHDTSFTWPEPLHSERTTRGFCRGLRNQVGILVDGTVVPCCLDNEGTINMGNIKETSIDEIIESPRAVALYNGFSEGKAVEPLCKRCGFKSLFTRKNHCQSQHKEYLQKRFA